MFKARAGDDSVGVGFKDMWRAVQRESVRDSLFESGGLFFTVPFAVVVHAFVWGDGFRLKPVLRTRRPTDYRLLLSFRTVRTRGQCRQTDSTGRTRNRLARSSGYAGNVVLDHQKPLHLLLGKLAATAFGLLLLRQPLGISLLDRLACL